MLLTARMCIIAALLSVCLPFNASAQQPRSSVAAGINEIEAPIPEPLLNGKSAFVSYELGDVTAFPSTYSGGPERAYKEFYTQMREWGRFELVGDPKNADIILAIRFVDSPGLAHPQMRLGIMSSQGRVSLWGFVESVDFAFRKKNRDADFSATVKQLISDLQTLLTPPPSTGKR